MHESHHEPDLYRLLGVAPTADAAEIARAYRRRVRDVHPDTANPACRSAEGDAPIDLDALQQAYAVLRDPSRRAQYDAVLRDTAHLRAERSGGVRVPVRVRSRPARVKEPLLRAGPVRVEPLPRRRAQPPDSAQGSVT